MADTPNARQFEVNHNEDRTRFPKSPSLLPPPSMELQWTASIAESMECCHSKGSANACSDRQDDQAAKRSSHHRGA